MNAKTMNLLVCSGLPVQNTNLNWFWACFPWLLKSIQLPGLFFFFVSLSQSISFVLKNRFIILVLYYIISQYCTVLCSAWWTLLQLVHCFYFAEWVVWASPHQGTNYTNQYHITILYLKSAADSFCYLLITSNTWSVIRIKFTLQKLSFCFSWLDPIFNGVCYYL